MMNFIDQCPNLCVYSSAAETKINKNQQKNLKMISFRILNQLMMKIPIKKQSPLSWPYTNLKENKIRFPVFYVSHRKNVISPEDKFQNQWELIQ